MTDQVTPAERIQRAWEKATKGEWQDCGNKIGCQAPPTRGIRGIAEVEFDNEHDMAFIIAAHNLWPAVWQSHAAAVKERDELRAELLKTLSDAADDVRSWGAYASEYYQEKWHLSRDIKRYEDRMAELAPKEPPHE